MGQNQEVKPWTQSQNGLNATRSEEIPQNEGNLQSITFWNHQL